MTAAVTPIWAASANKQLCMSAIDLLVIIMASSPVVVRASRRPNSTPPDISLTSPTPALPAAFLWVVSVPPGHRAEHRMVVRRYLRGMSARLRARRGRIGAAIMRHLALVERIARSTRISGSGEPPQNRRHQGLG